MKTTRPGLGPTGGGNGQGHEQPGAPGKRTLTEAIPVQHKLRAGATDTAATQETAAQGVGGAGGRLPHLDTIQAVFGRHGVTGVRAHTDANAHAANEAMGAEGYATGQDVAFSAATPSLHTAAHEAAHVVQQRAGVHLKGGVGEAGDAYEQHADRVADLAVAGKSAEAELSAFAGSGGASASPAAGVQHKLKLSGDKANVNRALAVMNKGLFCFTAKVDGKGYVTLEAKAVKGKANAQQQAMHDHLEKIISDPADIAVDVESGTKTLVGSYATGKIDMKDIEAMAGGTGATDLGSLIHELVEQYHKQVKKTGYGGEATGAHHEGIEAENAVNGTVRGPQKVVSATQHPDGTLDAVVEVPYTYPDGKVVTTTLTIVKNDVTRSEDKVTNPGKAK
jgi:hypothetical protein